MTRLPDTAWRHREGLAALLDALDAGDDRSRFVGGAVRDTLLGLDVADIDIATRLTPQAVLDRLRDAAIRAVPTGLAHGTITAVLPGGPVEVTTLRRDLSTDGRHAIVAYTDDWREDATRRDFTMNALYADANGDVVDYFGGLDDIAAARVRFIGDPLRRIAEDHLRILRFFRFHARFGDTIDPAGLDACTVRANDLMALSRERIASELLKLLVAQNAVPVVALMIERGILRAVLPEIDAAGAARLATLAVRETSAGVAPDPIRRFCALLPRDPVVTEAVGTRLRLSKAQRRRIDRDTIPLQAEKALELGYMFGTDLGIDLLLLSDRPIAEVAADVAHLRCWEPPTFALAGGAIIARGVAAGPDIARLLKQVKDRWIAEGFPDESRTMEIADSVVAQALASRANADSGSSGRAKA